MIKKIYLKNLILIKFLFILSSCATHTYYVDGGNWGNNGILVNNAEFKFIGKVRGEAEFETLALPMLNFISIGSGNADIYNRAMADIYNKAQIGTNENRGLINITYDHRVEQTWFWKTTIVTITADVIEFADYGIEN